jgi:hypothetical protein
MNPNRNYLHTVRVAIALGVMLTWTLVSLRFLPQAWAPVVLDAPLTVQANAGNGGSPHTISSKFPELLKLARDVCPQDRPFVLVGNEVPLFMITDYYMYPRRIVHVTENDTLDLDRLGASGGCIAAYKEQNLKRLDPVQAQLSQVACSTDGCLYLVR